jgi:SAM-dependent methyltransferase
MNKFSTLCALALTPLNLTTQEIKLNGKAAPISLLKGAIFKGADPSFPTFTGKKPEQDKKNRVPTLNSQGFMRSNLDDITQSFIFFSTQKGRLSLDIGCAFGFVAQQVLKNGGEIIANDVDIRHLAYLKKLTPKPLQKKLSLLWGRFPQDLKIKDNSLDAVYIGRVLHFLTPNEIETGFFLLSGWLKPGGRIFIVTMSPYHSSLPGFEREYLKKLQLGESWPGQIKNMRERLKKDRKNIPDYVHLMDQHPFETLSKKYGFRIIQHHLFDYEKKDPSRSGKEYLGIILEKAGVEK